jgi:uncharacterized membrane protein
VIEIYFLFFIFGFLGWSVEVVYAYYKNKKLINRGFLLGPICPIYGVGIILIYVAVKFTSSIITFNSYFDVIVAFLIVTFITTILEYITGDSLEKLFHTRWWDYSERKFNFKGHICIEFSLIWGLAGTIVVYFIDYIVIKFGINEYLDYNKQIIYILIIIFTIDLAHTVKLLINFRRLVFEFEKSYLNFREVRNNIFEAKDIKIENLKTRLNKYSKLQEFRKKLEEFKEIKKGISVKPLFEDKVIKYHILINKISNNRFFNAFPDMKFKLREVRNNHKHK